MLDDALFNLESETAPPPASAPAKIAKWQVDLLRDNFDSVGLSTMEERRELVQRIVGRNVSSLSELSMAEGYAVLRHLGDTPTATPGRTSSESTWDNRDSDTWIDRL